MNPEELAAGLRFATKFDLTPRETEILVPFLEKPYTTQELAGVLKAHKTSLHHIIQRLKLKKLLVLKDRDTKGTNLYEFNKKQLSK